MIVGKKENLAMVDEIVLDTSSLDITTDTTSYELSYVLKDLLPDGVYVYGEDKTVSIKVETDSVITKSFSVPVNDIAIKSLGDGLSAAHETTGNITYTLKGRKSLLDSFTVEENPLFVSTKNLGIGDYRLEVLMDLEEGLELVQPVFVQVKILEKQRPAESGSNENNSSTVSTTPTTSTQSNSQTKPTTTAPSSSSESTSGSEETTKKTEDNPADGGV